MNIQEFPVVEKLSPGESIIQVLTFGQGSLALLTSDSRVLIPGDEVGKWTALPVPPKAN